MFVRFYVIHLKRLLIRFDVLKVLLCRPRVTKYMKNDHNDLRGLRGRCRTAGGAAPGIFPVPKADRWEICHRLRRSSHTPLLCYQLMSCPPLTQAFMFYI